MFLVRESCTVFVPILIQETRSSHTVVGVLTPFVHTCPVHVAGPQSSFVYPYTHVVGVRVSLCAPAYHTCVGLCTLEHKRREPGGSESCGPRGPPG